MIFNKKQRNLFYKKALEQIENNNCDYICEALSDAIDERYGTITLYSEIPGLFPEFKTFEPKRHEDTDGGGWWNDDNKSIRIKILNKCIKLTE